MTSLSIPFALDHHGNEVPIDEAERFKANYYRCPECKEIVNPRKGDQRQYFAHKSGVLDETDCSLSSQADVEEMVEELRTSDIEKGEENQKIRVYLGEEPGGRLRLFGVLPSVDWSTIPPGVDIDPLLSDIEVSASGVERSPVGRSFHPSEPEVTFELDPGSENYRLAVSGPARLENILGEWTADGPSSGDLFIGDQTRARRFQESRQIKHGEWVYVLADAVDIELPDIVGTYSLADWTVLAFPARPETEALLEEYSTGLTTDEYGFDADVVLPAHAHPTSDAPISSKPRDTIFVGVVPASEQDPIFEIVSIPKRYGETVELDSTGPGNPRYFKSKLPAQGSKRISVHQRNSSRHRLVHLHAEEDPKKAVPKTRMEGVGLKISQGEDSRQLAPLDEESKYTFPKDFQPQTLQGTVTYTGPEGLNLEIAGEFPSTYEGNSPLVRTTTDLESFLPNLGHWVQQGCSSVSIEFEGIGTVELNFSEVNSGGNA